MDHAAMSNQNIVPLPNPAFRDDLSELLRNGAQRLFCEVLLDEPDTSLNEHDDLDECNRRAVVSNGYLPEREVLTRVGEVTNRGRRRATFPVRSASSAPNCCRRI